MGHSVFLFTDFLFKKKINKVVGCSMKQEIKQVIASKNTKSPQINVLISQSNIVFRMNKATNFC